MKPKETLPSREVICECFSYDPEDGRLIWKERPLSHFKSLQSCRKFATEWAGREAGSRQFRKKTGEPSCIWIRFRVRGTDYGATATAIIYSIQRLEIPCGMEVDHEDRNPFNNKLSNLRLATEPQNAMNSTSVRRVHILMKGVHPVKGRFRAMIRHEGKLLHIGCFATEQQAHDAYCEKAKELQGEFHCPVTRAG